MALAVVFSTPRHFGLRGDEKTAFAVGRWDLGQTADAAPADLLRKHAGTDVAEMLKDCARVLRVAYLDHDVEMPHLFRTQRQKEVLFVPFRIDLCELRPVEQRPHRPGWNGVDLPVGG